MATLFEAYVTNAGKYSEGQLVGETLKFPTTAQEVEALLKRIGVDGVRYQEIFITSFDGDVLGLYDHLSEYENLDELNHLACLLSELTSSELETLEAVLDSGDHCSSVRDIINLTQNLDCYGFYPGVSDEETLGRIYVDDLEMLDVPDQVKPYFDYEAYGRDACIHENGHFAPGGYVVKESDHFVEVYHGLQDNLIIASSSHVAHDSAHHLSSETLSPVVLQAMDADEFRIIRHIVISRRIPPCNTMRMRVHL